MTTGSVQAYAPTAAAIVATASKAHFSGASLDAAAADFTGDRLLDIVEAHAGGLTIRKGTGPDSFADATALPAGDVTATRVFAEDLTADGTPDVVAYAEGGTTLWVLPGKANGKFGALRAVDVPSGINSVAFGDFDRNGATDVAIAPARGNLVALVMSSDDRKSFSLREVRTQSHPVSVGVVDIDSNGTPDLVVGTAAKSLVTLSNTGGTFALSSSKALTFVAAALATGDVNSDGREDVVVASKTGTIATLVRSGNALGDPIVTESSQPVSRLSVGLVDGDATSDVIASGIGSAILVPGLGDGNFGASVSVPEAAGSVSGVSLVKRDGGPQSALLVERESGASIDAVRRGSDKTEAAFVVTNTTDDPLNTGSLRYAVNMANANGNTPDTITFNIPTTDPNFNLDQLYFTIRLTQPLILSADNTSILGETQPDTNPFGPEILITGDGSFDGFDITGDACRVSGLVVSGFLNAFSIDGNSNTLVRDYIGTDVTGTGTSGGSGGGGANDLGCGDVVTGSLSGAGDSDNYNFTGTTGQVITLTAVSADPANLDPGLVLRDSNGNIVASDSDPTVGMAQLTYTVVATDNFVISVVSNPNPGTDSGNYTLTVACSGGNSNLRNNTAVLLAGNNNIIGDGGQLTYNVISGNTDGVRVLNSSGNSINGNIIGTDGSLGGAPGGALNRNGVSLLGATGTKVLNNTISGNASTGVILNLATTTTTISNNKIGANRFGQPIQGNTDGGIVINASSANTVGPNNIVVGNTAPGTNFGSISLTGTNTGATSNVISDNMVLQSTGNGIAIQNGTSNTVGPNNEIANSGGDGVVVIAGQSNRITQNSIHNNGRLGINLVSTNDEPSGVTPNDANDADTGPNTLLNFPVITGLAVTTSTVTVSGTAPGGALVEVFRTDTPPDPSNHGEGEDFLVSTVASGGGAWSATLPVTLPIADDTFVITATATVGNNTSEFAENFSLLNQTSASADTLDFQTVSIGNVGSQQITICNTGVNDVPISAALENAGGGTAFTVSSIPAEGQILSPGECTTVTVTFTPNAAGCFSGTLTFTNGNDGGATTIPVSGCSVTPTIQLSDAVVVIPRTNFGRTGTGSVTVKNTSAAPINVTNVSFHRVYKTPKVQLTSDDDSAFFSVDQPSFTLASQASITLAIRFTPDIPKKAADQTGRPIVLPDPSYWLPEKVKTEMRFELNGSGTPVADTVLVKASVPDDPFILGGTCVFTDNDTFRVRLLTYDPDGNLADTHFDFYNEANVLLTTVPSVSGLAKQVAKKPKGIVLRVDYTFTGFTPYFPSVNYVAIYLVDATGQRSQTGICDRDNPKRAPAGVDGPADIHVP